MLIRWRPAYSHPLLAILVWTCWWWWGGEAAWAALTRHTEIAITMVFGSFIAGATSEGGGAVAFPVFTKLLHIAPADAKVFSLAIQSVGMTAASVVIVAMRIPVEWWVIRWASLAGVPGMLVGVYLISPLLGPAAVKLSFTLLVGSFAVTLFALNRGIRDVNTQVPKRGGVELGLVLLAGFLGGSMSGLVGNGIDIIVFSFMVLLFRVCEKIATPTSVMLMAINSLVGFFLHWGVLDRFTPEIQGWWLAAVPIVVVGAPLGAMLCARLKRTTIARLLLMLIAVEVLTTLWLVPIDGRSALIASTVLLCFGGVYAWMYHSRHYEPA